MPPVDQSGTFTLGDRTVKRLGYGAMQLAGPGYLARPRIAKPRSPCSAKPSPLASITLTPATSMVRISLIRSSARLCIPYPDDLVIVTKVSARRGAVATGTDCGGAR
jgi:pyridoxine 4-dehydrogenase